MKKILAIVLGATVFISGSAAVHADSVPGEQFAIAEPADGIASAGVVIEDSQFIKNHAVALQAFTSTNSQFGEKPTSLVNCKSYPSKECGPEKFYNYKAFFGNCENENSHDCVLSVTAKTADGKSHKAIFVEDFPGKSEFSFTGDPASNLPNSGSSFIVQIPSLPHSKGNLYLVTVNLDGSKGFNQRKFSITDFRAGIFAVTVVDGKFSPARPNVDVENIPFVGLLANQRVSFDQSTGKISGCAQATPTRCVLAWPLPTDVEFSMSLKLQTKINGWIHGRLSQVSAKIETASDGDQLITVSGKPTVVPTVFEWIPLEKLPGAIKNFYASDSRFMTQGTGFGGIPWHPTSILKDYIPYTTQGFPEAIAWYSAIGDKASTSATAWSFRTVESNNLPSQCNPSSNQLTGIVTTNSNMFVAAPPDFNREDQTLDYKVSSPHFLPDGSVFKGVYNLVMRSEYARCLYKFTNAPVSASISILSADGTSQVATTVLGERDGWLYLSASNFTFSSPILKVKLTQAATSTPTPSESPTPVAASTPTASAKAMSKSTITCVKGKTTKKVTGINPKCPVGYKKK